MFLTVAKMASKSTVSLKTFEKWTFSKHFEVDVDEDKIVTKIKCVTCLNKWEEIKQEAKRRNLRGQVLNNVKQYIDGVNYVHKANVERHCKPGSLHEFGVNLSVSKDVTEGKMLLFVAVILYDRSGSENFVQRTIA